MRFPLGARTFARFPQPCGHRRGKSYALSTDCAVGGLLLRRRGPAARRSRTLADSTHQFADREIALASGALAQELVQLRSHEEDDRRDVEVARDGDQEQEVARRGLVVGEALE